MSVFVEKKIIKKSLPSRTLIHTPCPSERAIYHLEAYHLYFNPAAPVADLDPSTITVEVMVRIRLQALVYDILPSTTAVFIYAIGSRKLSANEQFFAGAQTVLSLL